jgi:chromosome segregation ATPase
MNIDSKIKMYEMSVYTNISPKIVGLNQQQSNIKKSEKEKKSTNNSINSRIKMKSKVINGNQRRLQDQISSIQSQEVQIEEVEKTLNQVKSKYTQDVNNAKKESTTARIKIKQLTKNSKEPKGNYENTENDKRLYIEDKDQIIVLINETLKKINKVKTEIDHHKSKLISLEQSLNKNQSKIEKDKYFIDYIKDEIIINPLEFIFIEGNVETGIIINIFV